MFCMQVYTEAHNRINEYQFALVVMQVRNCFRKSSFLIEDVDNGVWLNVEGVHHNLFS